MVCQLSPDGPGTLDVVCGPPTALDLGGLPLSAPSPKMRKFLHAMNVFPVQSHLGNALTI